MNQTAGKTEKPLDMSPIKYMLEDTFHFDCHPGVHCFTRCCRGIKIILTPYDIIQLKNRLSLTSEKFLAEYTVTETLDNGNLPIVILKLLDDEQQSCPFVGKDGCGVYEDRPTTCRYYPVGMASVSGCGKNLDDQNENQFFFIYEPHCRGFEEKTEWTIGQWRKNQGVEIHDEVNAEWTNLMVRKQSFPAHIKLIEQAQQMFFMASYDIDRFRRFVFESTFLKRYTIEPEIVEKIKEDEPALLQFALRWLRAILFEKGEFTPQPEHFA